MRGMLAILGLIMATTSASAKPVDESLRPVARPGSVAILQPKTTGLTRSLRPVARPAAVVAASTPATPVKAAKRLPKRGSVCRDRSLRGEEVGRVPGKLSGCGVKDAIRLREVAGVTLSQPSIMDCTTAKALKSWIEKGLKPAVGRTGGGVKGLRVAAHYSCRTRNNRKGAKISEHGKGKAIDISAIFLEDGSTITVLQGWNQRREGKILRKAHRAACGPFGTVLGPESARFHKDHFHFDTARHRGGSYCR